MESKLKNQKKQIVTMSVLLMVTMLLLLSLVLFVKYGIEPAMVNLKGA